MLVLTRTAGESIVIGDREIKITVLAIREKQVRIGIKAPQHVPVNREEVLDLVDSNGQHRRRGA